LAYDDERNGRVKTVDADDIPKYGHEYASVYTREMETAVGASLTMLWVFGNFHYWSSIFEEVKSTHRVIAEDEQLFWMEYKRKARAVWDRNIRND
jgi:hypothetical protein